MSRQLAGRYRLEEVIGAGGSAQVYRAVDERLGRTVAVKLLDAVTVAAADPAGRERFLREASTSAGFVHPHAVTTFDAGEDDGQLFIVMELVDGETVAARLAREGQLTIEDTLELARQILDVLATAHRRGIVHRDVKPANVLLAPDGTVKLADFGIAKRMDELEASVTRTGFVVGTPRYLAPEQLEGTELGPATDVYAVGILLYEMLAGATPFEATNAIEMAVAHQTRDVPDLRERRSDVPDWLAAVIERALAKDPADRFADATGLADALRVGVVAPAPGATRAVPDLAGERSDGTAVLPLPETQVVPHQVAEPTAPQPEPEPEPDPDPDPAPEPEPEPDPDPASEPDPDRPATVSAGQLAGILGIVAVFAFVFSSALERTSPSLPPAAADEPEEEVALEDVPPEELPQPVDDPPPDIIPGFPATLDPREFLHTLETYPSWLGEHREKVIDEFRDVLEESDPEDRRHDAEDLREDLEKWADDDKFHPEVAEALGALLGVMIDQPVA